MSTRVDPIDDLADRIGRLVSNRMIAFGDSERAQAAIGGEMTAGLLIGVVEDLFEEEDFATFVEVLWDGVARCEEMAS